MPQVFFGAPDSSVPAIVVFWTVFYLWFFAEMFFGYRLDVLVTAAGYAYRIAIEKRVLADQLGEPCRGYMRRTKRIIPFVL